MEVGPLLEADVRRCGLLALQAFLGDTEILSFARRADGTALLLRQGFFERLLKGEVGLSSCPAADVLAAQSDIRHLSLVQVLKIHCDNFDREALACAQAQAKFLSCVDEHLEKQILTKLAGTSGMLTQLEVKKTTEIVRVVLLVYGAHQRVDKGKQKGTHWLVRAASLAAILDLKTCEFSELGCVNAPTYCHRSLTRGGAAVPRAKRQLHWHVELPCAPATFQSARVNARPLAPALSKVCSIAAQGSHHGQRCLKPPPFDVPDMKGVQKARQPQVQGAADRTWNSSDCVDTVSPCSSDLLTQGGKGSTISQMYQKSECCPAGQGQGPSEDTVCIDGHSQGGRGACPNSPATHEERDAHDDRLLAPPTLLAGNPVSTKDAMKSSNETQCKHSDLDAANDASDTSTPLSAYSEASPCRDSQSSPDGKDTGLGAVWGLPCRSTLPRVKAHLACDESSYIAHLESELQLLREQLSTSEKVRHHLEQRLSEDYEGIAGTTCYDISGGDRCMSSAKDLEELYTFKGTTLLLDCSKDSRQRAQGNMGGPRKLPGLPRISILFKGSRRKGSQITNA